MLWEYEAAEAGELTLREGEFIENVQKDESGWWTGTLRGVTGIF